MPDYKEIYLTLFRATEFAANTLIDAQRTVEEMYLSAPDPALTVVSTVQDKEKISDEKRP